MHATKRRPRLLDLFCCQGGAGMGYHQAGFEVVGVDVEAQPRYPFEFHQADALEYLAAHGDEFDVWHGSPPCHDHTALTSLAGLNGTGWLLPATREAFTTLAGGRPWVIENVPGAEMRPDVVLCGSMFGLRTYRHRWFELGQPMFPPILEHRPHRIPTSTKQRRQAWAAGKNISVTGDVGTYIGPEALGIDWMTGNGLSQAIPPAYTRVIGTHLLEQLVTV
jgi:DNA (cytosine-5)-methyltransferase 1